MKSGSAFAAGQAPVRSLALKIAIIFGHTHGRNHHILWGGDVFMNPGCSLVDLLLFPIYFQFRKNKGNKTV